MTKVIDITSYLDTIFPRETAESYDNPGLITGNSSRDVKTCVLTLDITSDALDFAQSSGADMIICHHPLIFGGIDTVNEEDVFGSLLSRMIKNDITSFAAHTNLDKNHEFSNDVLARTLGAVSLYNSENVSCGTFCELEKETDIKNFIELISGKLASTGAISINHLDSKVHKLFVQGGSFDEDSIPEIKAQGVDTVVSGEIKHHICVLLNELGINTVIAGHRETERIFLPYLADVLTSKFTDVRFLVRL